MRVGDEVHDDEYGHGEVYDVWRGWYFVAFESGREMAYSDDTLCRLTKQTRLEVGGEVQSGHHLAYA